MDQDWDAFVKVYTVAVDLTVRGPQVSPARRDQARLDLTQLPPCHPPEACCEDLADAGGSIQR
jgi:hypothetical protein